MALPLYDYTTPEEYLAEEEASLDKHEYYQGRIYQMAGGTPYHNDISGNIFAALHTILRGSGCRAHNSDQRIYISANGLYTYPDVSVVCGTPIFDIRDNTAMTNPTLIVEVLSPTTEKYDRGRKFALYRGAESFQGYLLVEQSHVSVEYHQRVEGGKWLTEYSTDLAATIRLSPLAVELPLALVYEDIDFATPVV